MIRQNTTAFQKISPMTMCSQAVRFAWVNLTLSVCALAFISMWYIRLRAVYRSHRTVTAQQTVQVCWGLKELTHVTTHHHIVVVHSSVLSLEIPKFLVNFVEERETHYRCISPKVSFLLRRLFHLTDLIWFSHLKLCQSFCKYNQNGDLIFLTFSFFCIIYSKYMSEIEVGLPVT